MTNAYKLMGVAALTGLVASLATWAVAASAVIQVAPTNIEPPTITGTPRVGEALTANNGTWANDPTTFRYRWLRCNEAGIGCVLLAADGRTYRVGQADVGARSAFG